MAIHVIQSQRIDVLVQGVLQSTTKPSKNPFAVLKTQHFIVPTPAVEEWLTQKIAEQQGISANSQFHQRIRGFQWFAYQQVLEDKGIDTKELIGWNNLSKSDKYRLAENAQNVKVLSYIFSQIDN